MKDWNCWDGEGHNIKLFSDENLMYCLERPSISMSGYGWAGAAAA